MKVCNRCFVEKELTEFFKDKNHSTGRYSFCKKCKNETTAKWRSENRERYNSYVRSYNKKNRRRIHYKQKYGITVEQYEGMLECQGKVCWICQKTNGNAEKSLVIDHNHQTGKVRGLLCYGCNRAISILEKPDLLKRATEYLMK